MIQCTTRLTLWEWSPRCADSCSKCDSAIEFSLLHRLYCNLCTVRESLHFHTEVQVGGVGGGVLLVHLLRQLARCRRHEAALVFVHVRLLYVHYVQYLLSTVLHNCRIVCSHALLHVQSFTRLQRANLARTHTLDTADSSLCAQALDLGGGHVLPAEPDAARAALLFALRTSSRLTESTSVGPQESRAPTPVL